MFSPRTAFPGPSSLGEILLTAAKLAADENKQDKTNPAASTLSTALIEGGSAVEDEALMSGPAKQHIQVHRRWVSLLHSTPARPDKANGQLPHWYFAADESSCQIKAYKCERMLAKLRGFSKPCPDVCYTPVTAVFVISIQLYVLYKWHLTIRDASRFLALA